MPAYAERCFYCQNAKDSDVPEDVDTKVYNYAPCDKCLEIFDSGYLVVSVSEVPVVSEQLPVHVCGNEYFPTGGWVVVTEKALRTIIKDEETDKIIEAKRITMDVVAFEEFLHVLEELDNGDFIKASRCN